MYRLGAIGLCTLGLVVWVWALFELADWGRFRPWWTVKHVARLHPGDGDGLVVAALGSGLRDNDRLTAIDGSPYRAGDWNRLYRNAEPGREVRLTVVRDGVSLEVSIRMERPWWFVLLTSWRVIAVPSIAVLIGIVVVPKYFGSPDGLVAAALVALVAMTGCIWLPGMFGGARIWVWRCLAPLWIAGGGLFAYGAWRWPHPLMPVPPGLRLGAWAVAIRVAAVANPAWWRALNLLDFSDLFEIALLLRLASYRRGA